MASFFRPGRVELAVSLLVSHRESNFSAKKKGGSFFRANPQGTRLRTRPAPPLASYHHRPLIFATGPTE
jgi:hypothetical protein